MLQLNYCGVAGGTGNKIRGYEQKHNQRSYRPFYYSLGQPRCGGYVHRVGSLWPKELRWPHLLWLLFGEQRKDVRAHPGSRAREGLGTLSLWSGHLRPCLWRRTRRVSRSGGGAAVSATLSGDQEATLRGCLQDRRARRLAD